MNHHGSEKEFITAFWQIYEIDDLESLLKGNLIRPLFLKFFPQRSGYIKIIYEISSRGIFSLLSESLSDSRE